MHGQGFLGAHGLMSPHLGISCICGSVCTPEECISAHKECAYLGSILGHSAATSSLDNLGMWVDFLPVSSQCPPLHIPMFPFDKDSGDDYRLRAL